MIVGEEVFTEIVAYLEIETGILLPDINYRPVRRFVSERCIMSGIVPGGYLGLAKSDPAEYDMLMDAATINETYFFREEKHFEVLASLVLPELISGKKTPAFWSAACSTGEEAVSIAALAKSVLGDIEFRVFATDLNPVSLETFEKGEYTSNAFRQDGSKYHSLLSPWLTGDNERFQLNGALKNEIAISRLNLMTDDLSRLPSNLDLIFLRNTLVYMALETRHKIIDKISAKIATGGHLFLGTTEIPLVSHRDLKLLEVNGIYYFKKKTIRDKKMGHSGDKKLESEVAPKPICPEKSPLENEMDLREIMAFANKKMNNRKFTVDDDVNYDMALKFLDIVFKINSDSLSDAEHELNEIMCLLGPNEISVYLLGFIRMVEEKNDPAAKLFSDALELNKDFWPSRFYLGMLLIKSSQQKALGEFEACLASIDAYLAENSFAYHFLLEGFNAKYFRSICEKWVGKLRRTRIGENSGHA